MTRIKIIKKKVFDNLEYRVKACIDENQLREIYGSNSNFEFKDDQLVNTPLDFDLQEIRKNLIPQPSSDSDNAILIYEALKNLTPIAASNQCLWATLTHQHFFEYVQQRWPLGKSPKSIILSHWFFSGSDRPAYRRNAISGLWWAGHLTYSPWEKDPNLKFLESEDPYKYTKMMLYLQQIWFDVQERKWGCDLIYRICFIETFFRLKNRRKEFDLSETGLSNAIAKLFTAKLVGDVALVARTDPKGLIEEIMELSQILIKN
tara:strand:- start:203 stop:985 length:783 start_codon:yes stop_codon:yes gene_type:complete